MPTGSLGKRTPEPPLLAAMSPPGPRPPTLSLALRPRCRAAGAVMTTAAMPLVAVLSLRTTVSAVPVALISAAFIIIPLWHSPPRLRADFPERGELSWGALPPGDPWQCLETFWVSESDRGLWALPCRGWESGRTPCDASGSPQQGTIWSRVEMGCWLAGEAGPGSTVLSGHLGRTSGLLLSFATSCCVLMVHFMCQSARVLGGPVADRLCFWACPEEVKIRSSGLSGGGGLASGWQRTGRSALLDTHLLPLDMASLVLSPPGLGLQLANPGSAQSA